MTEKPTRRDLMKPVQLLGLAFGSAAFAGVVTLISMGFFQQRQDGQAGHALMVGVIVAGITFIVVLVSLALLLLTIDPAQVTKAVDHPVLYDSDRKARHDESDTGGGTAGSSPPAS